MYTEETKRILDVAYKLNEDAYHNDPMYNKAVRVIAEGGLNAENVISVINQLCINNKVLVDKEIERIKNENVRYVVLRSD